uniref:cytochrome c oxidase subunit II n=1 Tax=Gotra octocincta TaxID=3029099 RepID=UPI0023D81597|nr:cytochrome c oxidase subunit II [Gotra octocincta]WDQ40353.1 cytochrome c oxidase subunit 2 [Gotra octocincta]
MSTWSMIYLQNANSPMMENLLYFHDHAMMIIVMITTMIFYLMFTLIINKMNNKFILHNQFIEITWTVMPMIILIFLAIPSLKILYLHDELWTPIITIKSIGHQWYWSYEYSDFNWNIEFNSFMLNYNKNTDMFRLLDVDNRMVIPANYPIRMLISSIDVIHSWTVPSLGVKVDSIPGRINQFFLYTYRPGVYFGQCSEICGMNHSFMPIVVESTSPWDFVAWLFSFYPHPMHIIYYV